MGARYLNEEQKKKFREKRNKTMMERYGCLSMTNVEKVKQTKLEKYGDENYNNQEKKKQTCLERYGVDSASQDKAIREKISNAKKSKETQEKFEQTCLKRYGNKNINLVPEIRDKYTKTLLKNYGVTNPLKNKEIYDKHILTMKENGSFTTSKPEEDYYKYLLSMYDEDDIIRQYSDKRYPFNCDFYIKSEDKFIELNYHPSHNKHPFDETNEEDIKLLESLKYENSDWSNMIIDVWCNRDVHKLNTAIKNNLNYKVIYPDNVVKEL